MDGSIKKTNYSHEAVIDMIIAHPGITQRAMAACFGYTEGWLSQVMNSDAFREKLAERKNELVDPRLRMSVEERLRGLADISLEVLAEKLVETRNMNVAVRTLDISTRALGYGAVKPQQVQVNTYVALIPQKSATPVEWTTQYAPAVEVITPEPVNGNDD